jgi:acetyl esterase
VKLDPEVASMRTQRLQADVPPLYTLSLAQARADDLAAIQAGGGAGEPVFDVTDHMNGERRIRVYRPSVAADLGAIVYFYGGGWTLGSIETADGVARYLANAAGCVVVVPEYRLAPEHRFPTAVHDAFAATRWVHEHADELGIARDRIAVGGDSAGGNLAAAVTLLARDDGDIPLRAQLLIYPNTDYATETPSSREYDEAWMFNRHSVDWYWGHYLANPADGMNPLASPLRADDLSGLPQALVITAEHDPLRDQAEAYARRLSDSGVATTVTRYTGMVHGFFCMPAEFAAGRRAQRQAAMFLRLRLTGGAPDPTAVNPEPIAKDLVFLRPLVQGRSNIEIGEFTYFHDAEHKRDFADRNVLYNYGKERLVIGRYCCIASGTRFIMSAGNHPMIGIGTFPFSMFAGAWGDATRDVVLPSRGDTIVGNNVWFGLDSTVLPGVRIGDGAIIGAGAMVASDVPPYAIVAGNPARVIRRRFTDDEIAELLAIAWWYWPVEMVTAHARTIMTGDVAALRVAAKEIT